MEMQSECGGSEGQSFVKLLEALVGSVLNVRSRSVGMLQAAR